MRTGSILTAAAVALAMASTPVLAQAASPASKLSVAQAAQASRAGATMTGENQARGGVLIGVAALIAVGALVLLITDDDDEPASP